MIFLSLVAALAFGHQDASPYAKSWDQIRKAISGSYYARNSHGERMNGLMDKYAPEAKGAKSSADFEGIVNQMIAEFGDSHFAFLSRSDQGWYLMDALTASSPASMPNIGAWFAKMPQGFVVTMVLNGTPAEKQDLRKGDVLLSVEGKTFTPIDSITPYVGRSVQISVQRGTQTLTKQVEVSTKPALTLFLDATEASERTIQDHGRRIGYIHLWTMAGDQFKSELASAVTGKFKDTDAMILDIRDGFGGRPEGYGDPFFRPDVDIDWVSGTTHTHEQFGYGRPLVALVNEGSRSAKELFSYILKKSHRAELIGHTTAGNVLGTTPMRLSDGTFLEIPIVDVFADGNRLEGKGVSPDLAVVPEIDADGKDLMLSKALDRLKGVAIYNRTGEQTAQIQVTRKGATTSLPKYHSQYSSY